MILRRLWVTVLASSLLFSPDGSSVAAENRVRAEVQRVIDGDTVKLTSGEKVRLIGINAPEYQKGGKEQFYGRQAAEAATELMLGRQVWLEYDVEKHDRYGRTLAYITLDDGRFVNELLVAGGFARAKYYKPNGRYRDLLKKSEQHAKNNRKGLWSKPNAS